MKGNGYAYKTCKKCKKHRPHRNGYLTKEYHPPDDESLRKVWTRMHGSTYIKRHFKCIGCTRVAWHGSISLVVMLHKLGFLRERRD